MTTINIIFIVLGTLGLIHMNKINKTIARENKLLELENEWLRGRYEYYKSHCLELLKELRHSYSTSISKDQEIIEAVKYAMKNVSSRQQRKCRRLYEVQKTLQRNSRIGSETYVENWR